MSRKSTIDEIGTGAIVVGGLLVMGGLMFLLVVALMSTLPGFFFVAPIVQMILGFLGSVGGFMLRRKHWAAKFILFFVGLGVVVNLVVLVSVGWQLRPS